MSGWMRLFVLRILSCKWKVKLEKMRSSEFDGFTDYRTHQPFLSHEFVKFVSVLIQNLLLLSFYAARHLDESHLEIAVEQYFLNEI